MSWTCILSFSFIPLMASDENLPFMLPWQLFKFSNLDKIHMNRRGLLKKHFCRKKNLNICSETAKIVTFQFSNYKSMETISCHSNQRSYPIGTENIIICSTYRRFLWNMERIGFTASEEKSFEIVDRWTADRRTTNVCLYYKHTYEPLAQVS